MKQKTQRGKSIFQKQLEKEAIHGGLLLVIVGCLFFSVAIIGASYLNTRHNVQKHIEFLTQTFRLSYDSVDSYLADEANDGIFTSCMKEGADGGAVHYSLSKYNVDSPAPVNLILSDENKKIVYTSFEDDLINLHRITFNSIVCDNAARLGGEIYHTVYYFPGGVSECVFSKPLYRDGQPAGFVNAYLNSNDWSSLFSDYQYDSIITRDNGDIIFCSRPAFLPEHNANKFRYDSQRHMAYLRGNRYLISSRYLKEEVYIYSLIYDPGRGLYLATGLLTIVLLSFIWFAMILKISQLMAEKNARSVNILADEMRIIRHGDSGYVIEIHTGDEFEEIANQINRMVKSLSELNLRNTDLIRLNSMIEISNLQAQINPHFIYNTLDSIKYLIRPEPDKAIYLLEKFTRILRYSINNTKLDVKLGEDMNYIESYLYIQQVRFGGRFVCDISIGEDCMDYLVPKLLLQPIVENSLKYGFKKKMEVHITIRGWCEGDYLMLTAEDDGSGVPRSALETLRVMLSSEEIKTEHNGLQNLARRIVLEYGDESELTIDSLEGEWFRVNIRLKKKALH